jgi:hypothetical protein
MTAEGLVDFSTRDTIIPDILTVNSFPSSAPPVNRFCVPTLALHRSPLRRDGYKLCLYQEADDENPGSSSHGRIAALMSYRFAIAPDTGAVVGWKLTSVVLAAPDVLPWTCISYAGYGIRWATQAPFSLCDVRLFRSLRTSGEEVRSDNAGRTILELELEHYTRVGLSPYSHALLHMQDSALVVSYYV